MNFNPIDYLIEQGIIKELWTTQPKQQPLLDRYIKAHEKLGTTKFKEVIERCLYMKDHSRVPIKSFRGYCISALEQECKKLEA